MNDKKIVFLEVEKEDEHLVKEKFPNAEIYNTVLEEKELILKCKDAVILCPFIHTQLSANVINSLPNLKLIITRSVGYNHIDLKAAKENNIIICNVPDYGAYVIAEHVFALLLSGLRQIEKGKERIEKNADFSFSGLRGVALKGKTLGIIGTGKIGRNVARIASSGFLMKVLANDPYPDTDAALENHYSYVDLETIFKEADIITLHCPLLKSTEHLINEKSLSLMKDGVVIVNTSRGGVIKTSDLVNALKSKKVAYAFLDVLEHEENLKKSKELIDLPNVIVTPHIAFYADDSMGKMYTESFSVIEAFINNDEILNRVTGL